MFTVLKDKRRMASLVKFNTNRKFTWPPFFVTLQRNSPGLAADLPMEKGKHTSEAHELFYYFRCLKLMEKDD